MINFGIRLQSRQVSKDWGLVSELFNRTLWSCYNQTDPDFRIIVACHEVPALSRQYDERVEFIQVDAPIPKTHEEMMVDAGYKTHTIAMRIREYGGGYTMMVDADDLVSNRIARFVHERPGENGWATEALYYYYMGTDYLMVGHRFPCTHIINYRKSDLPAAYPEVMTCNRDDQPWLVRKQHGCLTEACREAGRPLKKLPFRAYVYVRNTGFNHSLTGGKNKETLLRRLDHVLSPKLSISPNVSGTRRMYDRTVGKLINIPAGGVRQEFSIDWL